MNDRAEYIRRHLARLHTLIPIGVDFSEFAARTLDEQIAAVTPDAPMGIVPPSILSRTQMLASARIAVELIDTPEQLAARPEGIVDLSVIEWLLRPALPLRNDVFEPPQSGMWKQLAFDAVKLQASAVCRLDISFEESEPIHIGTGFVAGEDKSGRLIIATNAHVVEEVLRIGWPANQDISFSCDFSRFAVDIGGDAHVVDQEYELHPRYDMAFLHLRGESIPSDYGVSQLPIASLAPEPLGDSRIGVIGHPAFDSRLDPFPKFFGFGNEFGIKRFSPGLIRALDERVWRGTEVPIVLHDATTLSGSSGSCIIDLYTMKVVGLHFGGWPLHERKVATHAGDLVAQLFESNGAVPLWTLRDDPLCSALCFT